MTDGPSFGAWLKRRRRELDLTQEALAERVGCSSEMIRKIEAGGARPSRQLGELLASGLELPKEELPAFIQWARSEAGPAGEDDKRKQHEPPNSRQLQPDDTLQPVALLVWHDEQNRPLARPFFLDENILSTRGVVIGRGASDTNVDVGLEGVAHTISRVHAEIKLLDGAFYITDKSRNGVEVNGHSISWGEMIELRDNSEIILAPGLGDVRLSFAARHRNRGADLGG